MHRETETDRQTDRQTDRHQHRERERQTNRQTDTLVENVVKVEQGLREELSTHGGGGGGGRVLGLAQQIGSSSNDLQSVQCPM